MRIALTAVVVSVLVGTTPMAAVAAETAAPPGPQPAVEPGRFLARTSAGLTSVVPPTTPGQDTAPRGWQVVPGRPDVDPLVEAARLSSELGVEVVPDVLLDLATDPLFDEQWYLRNTGQTGGTPGADVDADGAWAVGDGTGTTVAVIDTGIDSSHPDMAGRLWTNVDEVTGNGVDDDGNGFVDDASGWDFVEGDGEPQDDTGHGTKVAGILGSGRDDGVGIAGLAAGSRLMILRACAPGCAVSRVAAAIDYAILNGADVVNLSLGGGSVGILPLEEAVKRAENADVLVVAAAGNGGVDLATSPFYPASFPNANVLAVAASTNTDSLAGFSNYGATDVDLAAPGEDVIMPVPGGGWALDSGTSYAAPLTAAVAAMVRAIRPDLAAPDVRQMILENAAPKPQLAGTTGTGARLDAGRSMRAAEAVTARATVTPAFSTAPATIIFDASGSSGRVVEAMWDTSRGVRSGVTVTEMVPSVQVVEATVTITGPTGLVDTATATAYVGERFDDIATSVFFEDVVWLSATGRTDGCTETSYCTTDPITRGETAALIRRMLGVPIGETQSRFVDDDGSIFEADLETLAEIGVFRGCNPPTNDRVCPERLIDRGELAAVFVRAFQLPGSDADRFRDDDRSLFETDIEALAAAGITRGCNPPANDRFCPTGSATRGEMAAFLHRAS